MAQTKQLARRAKLIVECLEKLARHRPLDAGEAALLQEMVYRGERKNKTWYWTPEEDAILARLNAKWSRYGRNGHSADEIRAFAERFNRSYFAVHRRLERLRKARRWKRPQMFKSLAIDARLECGDGQARQTADSIGCEGRPAGF